MGLEAGMNIHIGTNSVLGCGRWTGMGIGFAIGMFRYGYSLVEVSV